MDESAVVGRIGENTYNSRLAEALRNRGLSTADFERIFPTLKGIAKPDVVFETNRGMGIVSAKFGCDKEVDALSTAQEYQQAIGKPESLAETFAVTYPKEREKKFILRVLATDLHGSLSWSFTTLDDLANKIVEVVQKDWEKVHRDIDHPIEAAIRVIRSGVNSLIDSLTGVSVEDFKALFGGGHLFESILGYDKSSRKSEEELLRSAAAYLFVNQILFYEILSRELKDKYPEISREDYDKPEVLKPKYFERVLQKDYTPIFGFDIAGKLKPTKARSACKKIILATKALFPQKIEHDLIGKVFHNLIPLDVRKRVAAYFTNSQAADLLARLAVESDKDKILDPACGSGTLLVSSYKQKLRLSGQKQSPALHRRYVENDLTGIDIMPFSAHLAAVHLALMAPLYETENVRIAIEDSTEHSPSDEIQPVRQQLKSVFRERKLTDYMQDALPKSEKTKRGAVSIRHANSYQFKLDKADVVIMNPPFTSNDNLPADYKADLEKRFRNPKSYANCITGKLSFQAYFLLLADKFLKEDGRIAAVLPYNTFVGKAFNQLVEFLLTNYQIEYIVYGKGRAAFSDNTALTEILLVARKQRPEPSHAFVLMGVNKSPTTWTENDIEHIEQHARKSLRMKKDVQTELCIATVLLQNKLSQQSEGLALLEAQTDVRFSRLQGTIESIYEKSNRACTFKELEQMLNCKIFAWELRIKGGEYYGFSALSICDSLKRMKKKTDMLVFEKETAASLHIRNRFSNEIYEIPKSAVCQQVRRLSGIDRFDITKLREYIISKPFNGLDGLLKSIYSAADATKFENRIKNEWERKVDKGKSHIAFARRIDLAAPGTQNLAVFSNENFFISANAWGIRNISIQHAKILTLWINSSLFIFHVLAKRAPTRGSWGQLDERYLLRIPVLRLDILKDAEKAELVKMFDNVSKLEFPSILQQFEQDFEGRKIIDNTILSILGFTEDSQRARFLNELYLHLAEKILALKETMRFD